MTSRSRQTATCSIFSRLAAAAFFVLIAPVAGAQSTDTHRAEHQNFLDSIGRWFDEQAAKINSTFKDTQKKIENFGDDAGSVAKTTVQGAKNAADAALRLPNTRVISGHEKCQIAANGAPDCISAAETICKAQGFKSGKSLDMTRAETCPATIYLSGHSSGSECKIETFVSRVLCQ